jgi:cytochrome c oxidase cbb3-type subunit 3
MAEETKNLTVNDSEPHDHTHEYDGIVELNNPAPNWILLIFMVTIWFSMLYAIIYFGYPNNGKDQNSEYSNAAATAALEKAGKLKGASGKAELSDKEMIEAGAKLFNEKTCIACHGLKGEGNNIGPNLTDNSWINGCSESEIVEVISDGKVEKGMTAFKNSLTELQIKQLERFITLSLVGSNPPNAKATQGTECK